MNKTVKYLIIIFTTLCSFISISNATLSFSDAGSASNITQKNFFCKKVEIYLPEENIRLFIQGNIHLQNSEQDVTGG